MPTSNSQIREVCCRIIADLPNKPGMIIDLGCGWGWYGRKLREKGFKGSIVGVDVWRPYLEKVAKTGIYNKLECLDIFDLVEQTPPNPRPFTIWLLMDVLEHLEKPKGKDLLDLLRDRFVFLSTPLFNLPQTPWGGNPHEEHKCFWDMGEVENEGFDVLHLEEIEDMGEIGLFVRRP